MKSLTLLASLALLAACGPTKAPVTPPAEARTAAISPTDTATVRRLCTAPDSVLAKRAPCVLRADFAGVRKF